MNRKSKAINTGSFVRYLMLVCLLGGATIAGANTFVAYEGRYKAKFVKVIESNQIDLMVETWPGYPRKLNITLPAIAVPVMRKDMPKCEKLLIEKARAFVSKTLSTSNSLSVTDIRMKNSGSENALVDIDTDAGSLAALLLEKGFARPSSIKKNVSWCSD